jgi:hypothetical protein
MTASSVQVRKVYIDNITKGPAVARMPEFGPGGARRGASNSFEFGRRWYDRGQLEAALPQPASGEPAGRGASQKYTGGRMEAFCLKERKKVEMKDPKQITMKNGKPATQGVCPNCGTKIFKIGKAVKV